MSEMEPNRNELIRKALALELPEPEGELGIVQTITVTDASGNERRVDFIGHIPPSIIGAETE